MNWLALVDGPSAAIVLGGTALATVMRCGFADTAQALAAIGTLGRPRYDADGARAELAAQIREIRSDGILRAGVHHCGDSEIDAATDALLGQRSVAALLATHESRRQVRLGNTERAVRCLAQAAELAPVFGLAGTLVSLSQLATAPFAPGAMTAAIAMAVVTTLYGLLLANLVLAPLARMVDRAGRHEDAGRQALIEWLAAQVELSLPHGVASGRHERRAA